MFTHMWILVIAPVGLQSAPVTLTYLGPHNARIRGAPWEVKLGLPVIFLIIGTKQKRNRVISHFPVKKLGSNTFPSYTVCKEDVVFYSDFNFSLKCLNPVSIIYVISVEFGVTYLYLLQKQY